MGVRLTNTHVSKHHAITWKVEIIDTDYTGTALEFNMRSGGFRLSYEGSDNPFSPILPSKVLLPIIIEDAAFESFISDIVTAREDRYYVRIKRGEKLHWVGRILIEQFTRENSPYPYIFKLAAIDGLSLLKDIKYNQNGATYFFFDTLKEHIFKCLNKIKLNDLYSTTDAFLTTSVSWTEASQTFTDVTEDAVFSTQANHAAFYERSDKGVYTYKNCFEVLSQICQLLAARIFMAEGGFRLVQVNENSKGQFREISYSQDGEFLNWTNTNIRIKRLNKIDNIKLGGGVFRYLPALHSVTNNYKHRGANNYIAGVEWTNLIRDKYDIGDIATEGIVSNDNLWVKITLEWESVELNNLTLSYYHKWRIELKVGNFYLKRVANVNTYNVNYETAEWTETPAFYELVTKYYNSTNSPFNSGVIDISFKTPKLREGGEGAIKLEDVGSFDTEGNSVIMHRLYNAYNPSIELLRDGKVSEREDIRTYELVNSESTGSTLDLSLTSIIGDGATLTSVGRLKVAVGHLYENSESWSTENGNEQILIQKLVMLEIMKVRKKPIILFEHQIQSANYNASFSLNYDDTVWVFMSGEFSSNIDTWTGTWFSLSSFSGGVTFLPDKFIAPTTPIAVVENPAVISNGTTDNNTIISILEGIKNATVISPITRVFENEIIKTGGVIGLNVGQTGRIINPQNGQSEIFEVLGIQGNDIQINHVFENDYPPNSIIIKDILTPEIVPSIQIVKLKNQKDEFTEVDFDLPTTESVIDEKLTVIRAGRQIVFDWDYNIENNTEGLPRIIRWKPRLFNENIFIKLSS